MLKFTAEFEGGQGVTMDLPVGDYPQVGVEPDWDEVASRLIPEIREDFLGDLGEVENFYVWDEED